MTEKIYYLKDFKSKNGVGKFTLLLSTLIGVVFSFTLINLLNFIAPFKIVSPLANTKTQVLNKKTTKEVFGFAPHWTINKLDNVDFSVLTTLAYFGYPINPDGTINTDENGYRVFHSDKATKIFEKAHSNGTKVVLTITQMDNDVIKEFLDNPDAQELAIDETISAVRERKIEGVNVDFEYVGNPGVDYKDKFSNFVAQLNKKMDKKLPGSQLTVSVYASSAKYPKLYDLQKLAENSDGIFMMAYDFATTGSDSAMPTAPLYGYKEGKYWYDIATAVDDFLKVMPKEKLILGLPWYGYNYPVSNPEVKAQRDYGYYSYYWWRGRKYSQFIAREGAYASTYSNAVENSADSSGWDDHGKVNWYAYNTSDGWRMIFLDDVKSLGIKYDFAKEKGLGGVGMWALGFDDGKGELWDLLGTKFGQMQLAKL